MKLSPKLILVVLAAAVIIVVVILLLKSSPLKGPESIAFDAAGKRFLVSNVNGGSILSMSLKGKYGNYLKSGLKAPRGIIIKGKNLYVADVTNVHIIDVQSAKITTTIPIDGALMLNDIALDKLGLIYVTDTKANCVFIINPTSKKVDKIVSALLKAPNGIIYDMPRNQMLIVGFAKQSPILTLSTRDRSVTSFMDSIYSQLDGIAIDDLGRIYISSWGQDMIFEIPQEQNRFIAKYKDIKDAADIFYYPPNNELIIPLNTQNKIIRLPLD